MSHPFTESLKNIEQRLEILTNLISKKQERFFDKEIINNDQFKELFQISSGTASNWRDQGLIAFSQINSTIIYRIADVNKMLDDNYRSFKKKQ